MSKEKQATGRSLTWEVSMNGVSDAGGPLQRDVVQKHGSVSSGAANGVRGPI